MHSIRHKFLPHLLNYKRKSNAECTEHMSDDLRLRHSLRAKCFVAWMFFELFSRLSTKSTLPWGICAFCSVCMRRREGDCGNEGGMEKDLGGR